MQSNDRFVVTGQSRAALERTVLALPAEPESDWSSYRVPMLVVRGESCGLGATIRLTQVGADVRVDATYRQRSWLPLLRIGFPLEVRDARRLLRAALGAPPEQLDPVAVEVENASVVARMRRFLRRLVGWRVVVGIASIVVSIASLAVGPARGHEPAAPHRYTYDSEILSARLAMFWGIDGAVCNGDHPLHFDHTGQHFTCTAGADTYQVTVTVLDPFDFEVVRAD